MSLFYPFYSTNQFACESLGVKGEDCFFLLSKGKN